MVKLKIVKDFPFAHDGIRVEQYLAGTQIDTEDPELVKVAVAEGWAKKVKGDAPENKALVAPDEAKADAPIEETPPAAETPPTV